MIINDIPLFETLLILAMLVLGGIGYLSLLHKGNGMSGANAEHLTQWVVGGLIGLAFLAVLAFIITTFLSY